MTFEAPFAVLQFSAAPEGYRSAGAATGEAADDLVAILGRPRGQPSHESRPTSWYKSQSLRSSVISKDDRHFAKKYCTNPEQSLRSSAAPEDDRHFGEVTPA